MLSRCVRQAGWPLLRFLLLGLAALTLGAPAQPAHASAPSSFASSTTLLQFASHGQLLGFQPAEFYISNGTYALHVQFVEAQPVAPVSDVAAAANGTGAPSLSRVTYANLWDGITLNYDASRGLLTSTYRLEPRADVRAIQLGYNAPVTLNPDGTLNIAFATGQMIESAPVAWQEIAGERVPVRVAFESRSEREVGFAVGDYNASVPLFIDPTLTWNTFLGGDGEETGNAVAVDGSGNVYVTGRGWGTWGSPILPYSGTFDAFVAKLSPSGKLIWNTFLGDLGNDEPAAIAVDANGNVYIAGYSNATWGSPVRGYSGGPDGFAAKLNSNGGLLWNTFLGSSGYDLAYGIAVDTNGNVYVTGEADGTWGKPIRGYLGAYDTFLAKLSPTGALTWNTFLGGVGYDRGYSATTDTSGNVYVAGYSDVTWGSPLRTFKGGMDAFVGKVTPSGALAWHTFLGGSAYESASSIAVDGSGNIYIAGDGNGTWGSPVRPFTGGERDAFAAKLSASGALTWNTFLGGSGGDYGRSVAANGNGKAYVVGYSNGTWGSPVWPYHGGYFDAYAVELGPTGALNWQAFVGGSGDEQGSGGAVDANSNVYVTGSNYNSTWGAPVRPYSSSVDGFVAKIQTTWIPTNWVYLPLVKR